MRKTPSDCQNPCRSSVPKAMRSYDNAYRRMMRIWNRDQPASTLVRARAFLRRFPQCTQTWTCMGALLTSMARYSEARAALTTGLRLSSEAAKPPVPWTYVLIGDTFEQAGDFPTALAWYQRALEIGPHDADIHFALAELLHRWGRLDEAGQFLQQPRQCTTGDLDDPWYALGLVHRSRERFDDARRCFRKAIRIEKYNLRAKRALADVQTAIASRQRHIANRASLPSNVDAYDQMDRAWHYDKPAHNVLLAKTYLAQDADNFAVWIKLGSELIDLARYDEARQALQTSIDLREALGESPFRGSYVEMGRSYRRAGDYRSARAWFEKAVQSEPDDAGVHIFLGALLAKSGRFEQAKASHQRGTSCENGCPDEAWHNLGLVLRAQERFEDAAQCFERALEIDCNYANAHEAHADVTCAIRLTQRRHHASRAARADLAAIG